MNIKFEFISSTSTPSRTFCPFQLNFPLCRPISTSTAERETDQHQWHRDSARYVIVHRRIIIRCQLWKSIAFNFVAFAHLQSASTMTHVSLIQSASDFPFVAFCSCVCARAFVLVSRACLRPFTFRFHFYLQLRLHLFFRLLCFPRFSSVFFSFDVEFHSHEHLNSLCSAKHFFILSYGNPRLFFFTFFSFISIYFCSSRLTHVHRRCQVTISSDFFFVFRNISPFRPLCESRFLFTSRKMRRKKNREIWHFIDSRNNGHKQFVVQCRCRNKKEKEKSVTKHLKFFTFLFFIGFLCFRFWCRAH